MTNQIKTIGLLGTLSGMLILLGTMVNPQFLWLYSLGAVVMNLVSYFFSDKMVLKMNKARPVSPDKEPELHTMLEELSARADIPTPRLFVVDDPTPNAFATGRNPKHGVVAITTGIRSLLTEQELRGVIAHELAHIKNRDILISTIGAMFAVVIQSGASLFLRSSMRGGGRRMNPLFALAATIVVPLAATFIQFAISRTREYIADATGAEICQDPMALASALGKLSRGNQQSTLQALQRNPASASLYICSPFSGGAMKKFFSTHPPIPERIKRLSLLAQTMDAPAV